MLPIPYKLDIYYTPNLNFEFPNKPYRNTNNIINTNTNTKNIFKEIVLNMNSKDKGYLVSKDDSGFKLNIEVTNNNRINNQNYSSYVLTHGLLGVQYISPDSDFRKYVKMTSNEIVLKIIENNYILENNIIENYTIDEFIEKWNLDRIKFKTNLPEIYLYGSIYDVENNFLSYYWITKKYYDYTEIIKKNFNFTINYFKKLLILLDNIVSSKYIYKNLYLSCLGFEKFTNSSSDNDDFEVIILKYSPNTFVYLDNEYYSKFSNLGCLDKSCVGKIIPYYIIDDFYYQKKDWFRRIDKSYSLGLIEIILILFYDSDKNLNELYEFLIGPSVLESRLQYYHLHLRFDKQENILIIFDLIEKICIRFPNINIAFDNILKNIILGLLEKDYNKIPYPNMILNQILGAENYGLEINNSISYKPKENIYFPENDNQFVKDNQIIKHIILDDNAKNPNFDYQSINNQNINNQNINNYNQNVDNQNIDNYNQNSYLNSKYEKLYLKYKMKYINLKKNNKIPSSII
jgi:hypothetical protein